MKFPKCTRCAVVVGDCPLYFTSGRARHIVGESISAPLGYLFFVLIMN